MIKTLLVTCLLFLLSKSGDSQDVYVVHPSLSPDGNQLAFSYQGDIWTMSVDESIPRRLTIHESYEHSPMWSPDGKSLAFVGNRWGNNDIYTIAVDGGSPKRLTYHSAGDDRPSWVSNDRILFTSRRNFAQAERESEIWSVSVTGGTPERYVDAVGLSPHMQANGNLLAFVRGNCRTAREAYRGPANRQVWTYNSDDGNYNQVTTDEGQDILPKIIEDYLYFLSARSGVYNLHRVQSTTPNEIEQITNFDSEGITHYDVSADNSALIFTRGGQTYFQKIGDDEGLRQLTFDVPGDERFDQIVHRTVTNQAQSYALSPDEEQMAFEVRGELFLKKNDKDKSRAKQLTKHAFRDKQPVWVNDSVLIFSSDREGTFDLYALTSGSEEKDLYETFDLDVRRLTNDGTEEEGLSLSPDRSQLIYREGRGRLVLMDVDSLGTLTNRRVLLDGWDTPGGVTWSPDGKWIAYSLSDLDFNEEIYIHSIEEDLPPVNVSLHPRSDYSPKWSKDGSKLGFLSERNNGDTDVWFVWLSKSDWDKTQRDWEDEEDQEVEEDSVLTVQIDFERIHERLVQVTSLAGNEGDLSISHDGETFYFTDDGGSWQGGGGTSDFYSIKWDGDDLTKIITDISLFASSHDEKGKHIYAIRSGGSLIKIDPKAKKQETLSFKGRMDVDYPQERQQVFDEAWRRLRDGFYDPEFHGYDWSALRERYEDRCLAASTQQDFRRFINEMLGQLNASHMGVYGGSREETQREQTGLLGIDYSVESNGIRIQRVIPEGPADREESKLLVDDLITAINGQQITNPVNLNSILNGTVDEKCQLTIQRDGTPEEVIIRPTRSIRSALYRSWVDDRRQLVERYSNGRLGYIHIQGMNWTSFERFERELTASGLGKDGLVIDVRFNGGGWTTDMLMTVLNVRQHSYTIPRGAASSLEGEKGKFRENYPYGERLPLSSWTKPRIALCNENSYSNAEIFSHAFQALGHGTLVGRPTFGAVISTGGAGLLDGSFVRMPFRAWYVKSTDKNMEHGPAVPDIEVFNAPDSKAKGEDPQLKAAVDELIRQIDAQ